MSGVAPWNRGGSFKPNLQSKAQASIASSSAAPGTSSAEVASGASRLA